MKRLIALTAASVITLAGAASAMTADNNVNTSKINRYAPNVDVSQLTDEQIGIVLSFIHGGDNEGEKGQKVRAYLN